MSLSEDLRPLGINLVDGHDLLARLAIARYAHGIDEVRVLCHFVPSRLQSEVIEAELRPLLPPCCQRERISVRVPDARAEAPHYDNLQWHQDGGGSAGTTQHMVVWASEMPTELKTSDGEMLLAQPFDLVWYDNTRAFHRQPEGTNEATRWFVSVRCSGAMS